MTKWRKIRRLGNDGQGVTFEVKDESHPDSTSFDDLKDELRWDESFKNPQARPGALARRAKHEVASGLAKPFHPDQL